MAQKQDLKGIVVPVITPVDDQDRVDESAFRKVIRHLIDSGVRGLLYENITAIDYQSIRRIL